MRVSDLMSCNIVTIDPTESCREAVARMHRARVRHLPVVERGRLVGIVTDRDLRHRLFTPGVFRDLGSVPVETLLKGVLVSDVMSSPVVAVAPEDDLEDAAKMMLEDKVGSLPVVESGRIVGMITETDLLRRIVQADSGMPDVDEIIVSYP
jgi:acetoin utilization protein AcuB